MSVTSLYTERQKRDRYRLGMVARVFAAFDCDKPCCMEDIKQCGSLAEYRVENIQGFGVWSCQRHLPISVERFLKFDPKHPPTRHARPRYMHLSYGLYHMKPYARSRWRKAYRAAGGQHF